MDFEALWEPLVEIVHLMIYTSLKTSAMPERFRLAKLNTHLRKMGLEIINANFRPVSNLAYAQSLLREQLQIN